MLGREIEVHRPSVAPGRAARQIGRPDARPSAARPGPAGASLRRWIRPGPTPVAGVLLRARRRSPPRPARCAGRSSSASGDRDPRRPTSSPTEIGASRTGVLQQLRALEATHFVSRQTVRHGVGRPRHLYDITPDAQELFPTNYDGLAAGLLAAIGAVGGDALIEQIFQARRRQSGERVRGQLDERRRARSDARRARHGPRRDPGRAGLPRRGGRRDGRDDLPPGAQLRHPRRRPDPAVGVRRGAGDLPRRPRRGRRARDAHRLGRPLLLYRITETQPRAGCDRPGGQASSRSTATRDAGSSARRRDVGHVRHE